MLRKWLLIAIAAVLCGCSHIALRDNTVQTTDTLADLQYQQVLDNLARFQDDPDAIPSFAVPTAGTVSINDQVGIGVCATYSPPDVGESTAGLSGQFPGGTLGPALAPPVLLPDGNKDLYIMQEKYRSQFAADVSAVQAALMFATQRPVTEAALHEASGPTA